MPVIRIPRKLQMPIHAGLVALLLMLNACSGLSPKSNTTPPDEGRDFMTASPERPPMLVSKEELEKAKSEDGPFLYHIGPGDAVNIKIWRRPELSQERIVVSPDGNIEVPRIGMVNVSGKTPEEIQKIVTEKLSVLYISPEVTVQVLEFQNNRAFVLGHVNNPGVVRFPGRGTLLEGLALAGGVPKEDLMSRCSIIRGNQSVIWVNLQELFKHGNMSLNMPISNNDIIYVPARNEEMVYIMGEVRVPGAMRFQDGMSVFRAIMLAGGMNRNANTKKIFIVRQQQTGGTVVEVDLDNLVEQGDFSKNFILMPDDIVYVSPTGLAKFNYALEKIMPSLQLLSFGTSTAESFGVMQKLRQKLWGQQGFVNGTSTVTTGSGTSTSGSATPSTGSASQ